MLKLNKHIVLFRNPNKWNGSRVSWLRVVNPFVLLAEGVLELVLLPTPFSCNIYTVYLRCIIKADMKHRIKHHK